MEDPKKQYESLYNSALSTWKFQIESFWIRASSFAVFELAFAAGLWKLFDEKHFYTTIGMSIGAITLTIVWVINNFRLHDYITYYKNRLDHYEGLLGLSADDSIFLGFEDNRPPKKMPGSYHLYVQCIPALFLVGWVWMLIWSVREVWYF